MKRVRPWLAGLALALASTAAPAEPRLEAADLEVFFAGELGELMAEYHVPGAVVLVVKDGAVVFAHGYGVADLATGRPVDPDATLFDVSSISKPVTATAVMQLVEQGRLDLDADVNRYLTGMRLPATFPQPITLRHLLTHTAGFSNAVAVSEPFAAEPMPLSTALVRLLPPIVRPPGALLSYSNYGYALAGHLIEEVTGQPFDAYLGAHLLEPLGMTHSRFSLPSTPPPELAVGYRWMGGHWAAAVLDRPAWVPASDLYTSAADMSRFMLAHLSGGRVPGGDARILREETIQTMHTRAFSHHPELSGWCLGFGERRFGGLRAIGHDGGRPGWGSDLVLAPDAGVGLFVAANVSYDPHFLDLLESAFFERYFPIAESVHPPIAAAGAVGDARDAAGRYIPDGHFRDNILKVGLLFEADDVTAGEDGTIQIAGDLFGTIRGIPIGRNLWRDEKDQRRIAVLRGDRGAVEYLAIDDWAFDRVSSWEDPRTHAFLFGATATVFAATLLGCVVRGLASALGRARPSSLPGAARASAAAASAAALGNLAGVALAWKALPAQARVLDPPSWLRIAELLPLAAIAFTAGVIYWLARSRPFSALARLHFAVLALALSVYLALAFAYNLVRVSGA